MPLSEPTHEREEIYFRHVNYTGYRRDDDLWEIEGHFVDRRPYDYPCVDRGGFIRAGETFHEMTLRLTVNDDLFIKDIELHIEKFPYKQCPLAEAVYKKIIGMQIVPGFNKEVRRQIPATLGCVHIYELLLGTANCAFQTLAQVRFMKYCRGTQPDPLNTCLAWDSNGPMVKREWPDFYTGEK
ncbi:MAG: DUF2889 domain-containing protein [Alphaproteobacteria bacterium]|nr:DUF2889 domain-containing protein [Alphaproteobacteria bacterium]